MIKLIIGDVGAGKTVYLFNELRRVGEVKRTLLISKESMIPEYLTSLSDMKNIEFAESKDFSQVCMILFSLHEKFDVFAVDNHNFNEKELILLKEVSKFIKKDVFVTTFFDKNEYFRGIDDENVENILFYEKFNPTVIAYGL